MDKMSECTERDPSFFSEWVEQAYAQLPSALSANLILSLLLTIVLWGTVPSLTLCPWVGLVWFFSICRGVTLFHFRKSFKPLVRTKYWANLFFAGVLASGITWGVSGVVLYSGHHIEYNVLLTFCIGGLISGAVTSMAPFKNVSRLYIVLLSAPLTTRFLLSGQEIQITMGLMLMAFGILSLVMSAKVRTLLLNSLKLRNINIKEIKERQNAEAELRKNKEALEEIVQERTSMLMRINEKLTSEIAERKQAEERLRISEGRFRVLVENSGDWIWETDPAGVYTYSSPKVEALLGFTSEELIGKTPFDFMASAEAARVRNLFETASSRKEPISRMKNFSRHKDGRKAVLETNAEPILSPDGKFLGFRGIDRDITEREKAEEENLRQRNLESLGILAGGIAHDFNNLLTAVFGNIELALLELNPGDNAYQLLEEARGAIDKTKQLTGQLLTFSKGGDPVKEPVELAPLLAETSRFVLSGSALKCKYDIPNDLWTVNVDRKQIWQVLHNLIQNASEAMPDGGQIRLSAENVELDNHHPLPLTAGQYVRITVGDSGKGIPSHCLSKVFDPYYSTKIRGSVRGTGLGLSICHSVIKRHNGHITLNSAVGKGTEVSFYLPVSDEEFFPSQLLELRPKIKTERKKRILLMDDDEAVIQTVPRMLNYLGYDCEITRDGHMTIESYEKAFKLGIPFDLVILDLTVRSGMGGIETNRKLQKIDPSITAIVASGYTDHEAISCYQDYGFRAAIKKPYSLATLSEIIQQLI
jgi:PAS domain S-box-containing protein